MSCSSSASLNARSTPYNTREDAELSSSDVHTVKQGRQKEEEDVDSDYSQVGLT